MTEMKSNRSIKGFWAYEGNFFVDLVPGTKVSSSPLYEVKNNTVTVESGYVEFGEQGLRIFVGVLSHLRPLNLPQEQVLAVCDRLGDTIWVNQELRKGVQTC